jgi:hypothetical protein
MNAFQRVPVLQDGDFALTESVAIFRNLFQCFYLYLIWFILIVFTNRKKRIQIKSRFLKIVTLKKRVITPSFSKLLFSEQILNILFCASTKFEDLKILF